jgi:carboxyl-terminal processing protease
MNTSTKLLALVGLFLTAGCENAFVPQPAGDPEAVFENLWRTFDAEYAGFHDRGVDWQALYVQHRPLVTGSTTDSELFQVLSSLLAHLDDGHVSLTAPNHPVFLSNRIQRERVDRELFDLGVVRDRYLEERHVVNGGAYVYGKVRGEPIAYIHFGQIDGSFAMLPRMLDEYPDMAGYVVDLRRNGGGNHTFAFSNMGRLTDRERHVFRSRTKNGPGANDFTPWHSWSLRPVGRYVDRPIVVLTDRYTPSAAERAVMAFRTLPNAIIVGDTTNGSISTKIPRELANGWYYSLTPQQVEMFDGRSYEGRGIPPDVVVRNDREEMRAGVDRVLQSAIELLRRSIE